MYIFQTFTLTCFKKLMRLLIILASLTSFWCESLDLWLSCTMFSSRHVCTYPQRSERVWDSVMCWGFLLHLLFDHRNMRKDEWYLSDCIKFRGLVCLLAVRSNPGVKTAPLSASLPKVLCADPIALPVHDQQWVSGFASHPSLQSHKEHDPWVWREGWSKRDLGKPWICSLLHGKLDWEGLYLN